MVICLEQGADLHTSQLMPLLLTVSCFSKIQIGFTFLVPAHPGSPGQRAVKRVCVCVCDMGFHAVLFFRSPRSKGWQHHGQLSPFISVLCQSDRLFHGQSSPRLDVVHRGRAWSSSPACTWHCSLHYLFLKATPLFPHGMTIVC